MPIAVSVLRAHVQDDIDENITVRLHTGDPGSNGTANLIATNQIPNATITATSGWTVHGTLAQANPSANVNFGTALQAVNGVSHYSMFKGSTLYAYGALDSSMNVALGANVSITASSLQISYTST